MSERLLRGNETLVLIPAYVSDGSAYALYDGGMDPIENITTDCLNYWIPVTTANHADAIGGGMIACAVKDDMTLGLTDSGADTDRVLCDVGQVEELTTKNFEGSLEAFRDKDLNGDGAYNLFYKLTFGPDAPYIVAHRVSVPQTELATVGELWDFYLFNTDVQIPNYSNNANITVSSTLIPKNKAVTAHELTA